MEFEIFLFTYCTVANVGITDAAHFRKQIVAFDPSQADQQPQLRRNQRMVEERRKKRTTDRVRNGQP